MYYWNWEPQLLLGLFGQASAYLLCTVGPLRRFFPGAQPETNGQVYTFMLVVLTLNEALVSPLDALGDDYLLTAHMVQHLLLALVAPPLLLLGTPRWLLRPLVELPYLKQVTRPIGRTLTNPLVALLAFNIVFSLWHIPRYYEAALQDPTVHIIEHVTFFSTAVLTWWPIFGTIDEFPQLNDGAKVLYLFFQSLPPTILGAMITFANVPIYPTYAAAPRLYGMGALEDQVLGGLIMWVPGGLIFFTVLTVIFFKWFGRDDDDYWEYDTAAEGA
ncbi:MAG: cytochrome c oxidase assembly protein [Roseiflexaceae bacterium]|nr:cytochrome c oxidase assembly protein [Roseiflexaceae bacterium]